MRKNILFALALLAGLFLASCQQEREQPRIVNIVNFIRQTEPRIPEFTDEVLYQTVVSQVEELNKYQFKSTFLLQYDALINPKYQKLLTEETVPGTEIGGWWEITQPHVEAAGLKWRGRYPWDWHADVGFSSGYTPEEREKLVDAFMTKFKEIFGYYPKSIGSWFIDAHTIGYMYEKYGIVASCNCKDQMGTDGYTLWGGYWNQAYYPSKTNAYMPAQTEDAQIPVPVFRMLGSDPIYQYDTGIGTEWQGVLTLEPISPGGNSKQWVEWFFNSLASQPCLSFGYTQAGQENSFTWAPMKEAYQMQMKLLKDYADKNLFRIETLEESGTWFRKNFDLTPATAVAALDDYRPDNKKSVWYNSRFYRANLLWKDNHMHLRDIHLFDQRLKSDYVDKPCTSNKCVFTTLPVIDGFNWSSNEKLAGLRFVTLNADGTTQEMEPGEPTLEEKGDNLFVRFSRSPLSIEFKEDRMEITLPGAQTDWAMEFTATEGAQLPYKTLTETELTAEHAGHPYSLKTLKGRFHTDPNTPAIWQLRPENGTISLDCNTLE